MCDTCGCNVTDGNRHLAEQRNAKGESAVTVLQGLLSENDRIAAHNREHLSRHGIVAINLMSSPGSGKTALLERTIDELAGRWRIAVIEGDLETENDAERIRAKGVEAVQITTGTACHLDAHLIHDALHRLDLSQLDLLFIENVGNLVCPASFDLGQHSNVTLLSVTEGDDKPAKYPVIFRAADAVILSKCDLLPHIEEFSPERARHAVQQLAIAPPIIQLSAKTGEGFDNWLDWVEGQMTQHRPAPGQFRALTASSSALIR